jgi:hypothetical protein
MPVPSRAPWSCLPLPRTLRSRALRPLALLLAVLLGALLGALPGTRPLHAEDDPTLLPAPHEGRMSLYAKVDVDAHGDAEGRVEIHFAPADYARVKERTPDPRRFLQDVHGSRSESEVARRAQLAPGAGR